MKQVAEFIENHPVDFSENLVALEMLEGFAKEVNLSLGTQLTEYLLQYGYLGFKWVELHGVNSLQGVKSDLFTDTLYLNEYFPLTKNYIVIESVGDGDYVLVNEKDEVFQFESDSNSLTPANVDLFAYILKRFLEIKD